MAAQWTDWTTRNDADIEPPYVHWRRDREPDLEASDGALDSLDVSLLSPEFLASLQLFFGAAASGSSLTTAAGDRSEQDVIKDVIEKLAGSQATLFLPAYVQHTPNGENGGLPPATDLPEPPPAEAVIVGVIDTAVPLCHRRQRFADGKTRILAAWQQQGRSTGTQTYLPFGRELYSGEIDSLISTNSSPSGKVDDQAFNEAAGLVEMRDPLGHRGLTRRVAHGAHMLDVAAGFNPHNPEVEHPVTVGDEELKRLPVMVVNLPTRRVLGLSGSFLEYFIILGIGRIIALSDLLFSKLSEDDRKGRTGYRIVINLSFGMHAGPRDGFGPLPSVVTAINLVRKHLKLPEIDVIMPAGNDNLKQGFASVALNPPSKPETTCALRVQPEDQSSNFLEFYVEPLDGAGPLQPGEVSVGIKPPRGAPLPLVPFQTRSFREFGTLVSRLYCDEVVGGGQPRLRFVLCTAPSFARAAAVTMAPAGRWQISVRSTRSVQVTCSVQSDQSARPNAATSRRPYLDDPSYRVYDDVGRIIDAYSYRKGEQAVDLDTGALVRRHGTMNTFASSREIAAVGGFRLSDGKPVPYSGTAPRRPPTANPIFRPFARYEPTAAMPCERSAAHRGRLGAGARDGSVVALRGTSVSAAEATRLVALTLVGAGGIGPDARQILFNAAMASDGQDTTNPQSEVRLPKVGAGRVRPADSGRLDRLES